MNLNPIDPVNTPKYPLPATDPNPLMAHPAQVFIRDALLAAPATPEVTPAHTVKKGDNLTRVVRSYLEATGQKPSNAELYAAVNKIAQENKLRDADVIHPGQVIDLRAIQPETPALAAAPAQQQQEMPWARLVQKIQNRQASSTLAAAPSQPVATGQPEDFQALRRVQLPNDARPVTIERSEGGPVHEVQDPPPLLKFSAVEPHAAEDTGEETVENPARVDLGVLLDEILNPTKVATAAAAVEETWPMANPWASTLSSPGRLTSDFGVRPDPFTGRRSFHDGIDVAAPAGTIIYPIKPGVVTFSGWKGGYGRMVVVKHEDGVESIYAHNSKNAVQVGDKVDPKTPLGQVGSTGRSTGPHLHFEIRQHGVPVNPINFLQQPQAVQAKK